LRDGIFGRKVLRNGPQEADPIGAVNAHA
jgi:hypothetical protein